MNTSTSVLPFAAAVPSPTGPASVPDDLLDSLRGPSEAIARLWSKVRIVAPHFRTVLLTGEPGCGPETIVHLLQTLSRFSRGRLVTLDAGQDSAGAAKRLRSPKRLLQSVAGGVLYIPEVDRLSAEGQANLLRFLRLNRHHLCAVVAFSSRDLRSLVAANSFAAPLAEGLGSFSIALPTLRERKQDIPMLAESLLREASLRSGQPTPPLSDDFLEEAMDLDWPGNLDQLRAVAAILAGKHLGQPLNAADLHAALAELDHVQSPKETSPNIRLVKLDQVIQEHIRSVLIACKGNKLRASAVLGISRSTLYRILDSRGVLDSCDESSMPMLA